MSFAKYILKRKSGGWIPTKAPNSSSRKSMRARPKQKLKTALQARRCLARMACAPEEKSAFRTSTSPNQLTPYNKPIEPTARGLSRHSRDAALLSLPWASAAPGTLRGSPCRPTPPAGFAVHRRVIRTSRYQSAHSGLSQRVWDPPSCEESCFKLRSSQENRIQRG